MDPATDVHSASDKSPSQAVVINTETQIELSVVIPCLNEAETVGQCVAQVCQCFKEQNINGEVIVADNNSTDASAAIAAKNGARVVPVKPKGYGNALMGGIAAARGKFIVM